MQKTLARLAPLRLTTSHTYLYKKLDEFGQDYDLKIKNSVQKQSDYMVKNSNHSGDTISTDLDKKEPLPNNVCMQYDDGRKLTFDNLDYRQDVHHMTEEHQNIDKHCVTNMSTENRVTGNHLSNKPPLDGILNMENGKCLPSPHENLKQRDNYITSAEQIISKNIPCPKFLSDVSTVHIPHQYSKEMSEKTETVS